MNIRPGFWNCCRTRPSKVLAFDAKGNKVVWVMACAGCASTYEPSRVLDLAALVKAGLAREQSAIKTDCTSDDVRYCSGSKALGPARYALRMARACRENGLVAEAEYYLRAAANERAGFVAWQM